MAPMTTSRMMPPVLAAAKDSTSTPKRSSLRLTPAIAPLSAKTKVPARSSANWSDCTDTFPGTTRWILGREPRPRRDHECLDAGSQRRMHDWRELRAVVHRQFVEPIRLLRFRVDLRVRAAHEPEYRWCVPLGTKGSKILTCGCRARFANAVGAKLPSECVDHPPAGVAVVHVERVLTQSRDLRLARRACRFSLGIDEALDRGEHASPYARLESSDVEFDDGFVRNDILFRT